MKNREIEERMNILLNDNRILRQRIITGIAAEEQFIKNRNELQKLTKVYNDDLGTMKIHVRELKHYIVDNKMGEIVETIGKIEDLLGGRTNDNK